MQKEIGYMAQDFIVKSGFIEFRVQGLRLFRVGVASSSVVCRDLSALQGFRGSGLP